MRLSKILLITACGLLLVIVLIASLKKNQLENVNENSLPKIIQADWIDLDRIGYISKFRSGSGHDFSGGGETCRSMKHYFNVARTKEDQNIIDKNGGLPPPFSLEGAISIFSPVGGKIVDIANDGQFGVQVYIEPKNHPEFTIRLFHIYLRDGYGKGSHVSAGEQIGNIGRLQNTDIAVSIGGMFDSRFVSYFQVLPDEIFSKYRAAGVGSLNQLIISKEYRDAHPLECNGERFTKNYDANEDEFVFINNYTF